MISMPWAKPVNDFLQPMEGVVVIGLVLVVLVTVWVILRGNAAGKTAWLTWLMIP